MVKQFRVKISKARSGKSSQQKLNEQTPNYVDLTDPPELPDISLPDTDFRLPSLGRFVRPYKKTPNRAMKLSVSVKNADYIQHRMMDEGRAIALRRHPRRFLLDVDDDVWTFSDYLQSRNKPVEVRNYVVTWDGADDPLVAMGIGRPGKPIPLSDSTFGQYAPDSFVWCVYWLVNGIPDDSDWFPNVVPDVGVGPPFPAYDLNLID